mgnify:CR=1 FL=1
MGGELWPDRDGPGWPLLPPEATPDAGVLLRARAVRAFGDGFVSVLLPLHLTTLGFNGFQIGAVATATLLGSAALTLLVGLVVTANKLIVVDRFGNPHEMRDVTDDTPKHTRRGAFIVQMTTGDAIVTVYGSDYATRDGTGVRDYIHVMDVAEAHLGARRAVLVQGHLVHLGAQVLQAEQGAVVGGPLHHDVVAGVPV